MKTVKEVSRETGISVRTLRYYDGIGLFRPTAISEAGYRLYDDKAMEILQQILFFKEFDMPLKDIRTIMENPELDQKQILKSQRRMLEMKKERLERIISSIDDILKGVNHMDFAVFNKDEIDEMYQVMVGNMNPEQKEALIKEYGSLEKYQEHFLQSAGSEKAQKNYQKLVEWYGDKDSAKEAMKNTDPQIFSAYQKRQEAILRKLSEKKGKDVSSFEVKEIVGEYDFVIRQMYQLKDARAFLLEMADLYKNDEKIKAGNDAVFGEGSTEFMGRAIEAFYQS